MDADLIFREGVGEDSGRDLEDSSPNSAGVENDWSCICTPPYALIAWTGRNLFFKRFSKISESDC
jgi:hypothetical protein